MMTEYDILRQLIVIVAVNTAVILVLESWRKFLGRNRNDS